MHVPAASPPGTVTERANPLRDPSDRRLPRVPEPCALVVFGVTGDLARKKLLPAIYDLANRGLLPADFALLGFARRDWGDGDFADRGQEGGQGARPHPVERGRLAPAQREPPVRAGLVRRRRRLRHAGRDAGQAARHARDQRQRGVLPVDPAGDVPGRAQADGAHRDGRATRAAAAGGASWSRSRSATIWTVARELNELVDSVFTADDVFRIDHYLGKETVQNLMALRFANQLFEPIWNRHYVDSVQITMAEDVGIGGRAGFYDATGAARDVLQNHLLPAARAHRDGGAGRVLGRGDPYREAQGAPGDLAADRSRRLRDPRSVRPGLARR